MEIKTHFKETTKSTLEYMIRAFATPHEDFFYTKRILYINLQMLINGNMFFQYSDASRITIIKTLISIYQFMNGDISNNELYSKFMKLDKQVSSTLKTAQAQKIDEIEFWLNFGIKNGRRIYNLKKNINYIQHFATKTRTKMNIQDTINMYAEPEATLARDLEMYEQIYDLVNSPHREEDDQSEVSSAFWQDLADVLEYSDMEEAPTVNSNEYRGSDGSAPTTSKRAGMRKRKIKKTISNYKALYSHNKQNIKYYKQLINKISKL